MLILIAQVSNQLLTKKILKADYFKISLRVKLNKQLITNSK